jgi:hypothetical protein
MKKQGIICKTLNKNKGPICKIYLYFIKFDK